MISTGNDIVSFAATNLIRTKQPAFYSKILPEQEIAAYIGHYDHLLSFEVYVWLLWSVKEAVYKYLKRLDPALIFSPTKIIITQLTHPGVSLQVFNFGCLEGKGFEDYALWGGRAGSGKSVLNFRSLLYSNLVHSVVNDAENFNQVYWGIKRIPGNGDALQSKAVREFSLHKLSEVLGGTNLHITKDRHNIPTVTSEEPMFESPVSFSHHGQFIAYCFNSNS